MALDWHDFLNVAWRTVDARKARKMVMKIEIVYSTTYKTLIKNFRTFDHEKIWIEKIAKLLSHSTYRLSLLNYYTDYHCQID